MKRLFAVLLAVAILTLQCSAMVIADDAEWTCPSCGATVTGNFCSKCGEKRPETGAWVCPNCGADCKDEFCSNCGQKRPGAETGNSESDDKIRLDLSILFEKNAVFSTYDVKLFIDDEWITTMRHGVDYSGTVSVTPGKHIILFREDGSSYPSEGSTVINISEPSLYKCKIEATFNAVQISGERLSSIDNNRAAKNDSSGIMVDGDLKLDVYVEFRKNAMFSTYDVDLYCDDVFIATLPHGKDFSNTLLLSKGSHVLTFYKSGSKKVRGSSKFVMEKDASFSCKIEAEHNKVDVRKDKLTY